MGSIVTRKTGNGELRYQAHVRRKGQPAWVKTFNSRTKARAWITRTEAAIQERRDLPHREALKRTVGEVVEQYVEDEGFANLSAKEQRTRMKQLQRWVEMLGPITVAELTPQAIKAARKRLKATGNRGRAISSATLNRYMASLSKFCSYLISEELLQENPARSLKVERGPENQRDRVLTSDERRTLLEACSSDRRLHALVVLALTTGGRQGELLRLKWKEVHLGEARVQFLRTKNGMPRSLPLPVAAIEVLKDLSKVKHVSGLVFGTSDFPLQAWRRARKASKLEDFRFHDTRHCYATKLAEAGASLSELRHALGHKTLSQVLRYQHLTERAVEDSLRGRLAAVELA